MQEQEKQARRSEKLSLKQVGQFIRNFRFLPLTSKEQIEGLADFIGYRSQLALYETFKADLPWDEYVETVRASERIRKAVEAVAIHAVKKFDYSLLDFELPEDALEYIDGNDAGNHQVVISKIFSKAKGNEIVQLIIFKTELEHYRRLSAKTPGYTWRKYIRELKKDQQLWNSTARAFQHGLRQIDFRASWLSEEVEEAQFLRKDPDQGL